MDDYTAKVQKAYELKESGGSAVKWLGKIVKRGFPCCPMIKDGPEMEHMWCLVSFVPCEDTEVVEGVILNESFYCDYLVRGMKVLVPIDTIEAVEL